MNVTLDPQLKAFVQGQVERGEYLNEQDCIQNAVLLMKNGGAQLIEEARAQVAAKLQPGIDQANDRQFAGQSASEFIPEFKANPK